MFLTAVGTVGIFIKGFAVPSFLWILFGMIHVYFLIVVYSLYEILVSEIKETESLKSSTVQGYGEVQNEEP